MPSDRKAPDQVDEVERLLGAGARRRGRALRWIVPLAALVVLAFVAWRYLAGHEEAGTPRYRTASVARGPLVVTVSATGNLQPTNKVDVGSELSGIVESVAVDENDVVRKGQLLARLDLARLRDAVARSEASLAAGAAQVAQAQASAAEARANLGRLRQVAQLSGGKVPSHAELDAAEASVKRAVASEASAHAAVAQARAALQSDRTNLAKAEIRSPIDGIVLARKVQPGQTVAASFQAPVLFTLAEDLKKMELQVDVDEADVGQVRIGQKASFTVDAWPGRRYSATITRVGFGAQVKDGVVSYLTVLQVANDDLSLRPGMTGTAEIVTLTRESALMVPNAALRFVPPQAAPAPGASGGRSLFGALMPRPPRTSPRVAPAPARDDGSQLVWVLAGDEPQPVAVRTGASNGRFTEIVDGELRPGTEVIVEVAGTSG